MRRTNKVVKVNVTVEEEVLLNNEEIIRYVVDKRNQTLIVDVRLTGDDTSIVETETHRFFSNEFVDEPTEEDLWKLIDSKRSGT